MTRDKSIAIKTFLALKHGTMADAYIKWMHDFEDTDFTQDESDFIAQWAKETNRSTGVHMYDYTR